MRRSTKVRAAESGAVGAFSGISDAPIDPDVAAVIDAWPALPDPVKATTLAAVQAALHAAGQ